MTRRGQGLSRRLSWLLRHGAGEHGLAMDEAGWASVADTLRVAGITREELLRAVETNDKGRLELDGERIRACQGHSLANIPVSREALEDSWAIHEGTDLLWHGTALEALTGIAQHGIQPGARSHVHLAEAADSKVGKRSRVEVLLAVSPGALADNGLCIYRSPNGVVLVREVPITCIVGARPGRASLASQVAARCRELGLPEGDPIG